MAPLWFVIVLILSLVGSSDAGTSGTTCAAQAARAFAGCTAPPGWVFDRSASGPGFNLSEPTGETYTCGCGEAKDFDHLEFASTAEWFICQRPTADGHSEELLGQFATSASPRLPAGSEVVRLTCPSPVATQRRAR